MPALSLEQTLRALRVSFAADTSEDPEWNDFYASMGHSHIAALIIADLYGSRILKGTINGKPHYWNVIEEVFIDACADEFPNMTEITDIQDATNEEISDETRKKQNKLTNRWLRKLIMAGTATS